MDQERQVPFLDHGQGGAVRLATWHGQVQHEEVLEVGNRQMHRRPIRVFQDRSSMAL